MNSFTFIGRAIEAAFRQQVEAHEAGETLVQSTYDYDPDTDQLTLHRSKEEADDYRYFPEPDLVPLGLTPELIDEHRGRMPELPAARQARFEQQFGLSQPDALDLNATPQIADYFEQVIAAGAEPKAASDWVRNQPSLVAELPPNRVASLLGLIAAGTITPTIAKQVLVLMQADPTADPAALVEAHGLGSIGGGDELATLVDEVMAAHPEFVEQFRSGKDGVINALVGQVMKRTQGRADAKQVQALFRERL